MSISFKMEQLCARGDLEGVLELLKNQGVNLKAEDIVAETEEWNGQKMTLQDRIGLR